MIGGRELTPQDVTAILRRRSWWLIVPTLIMPVVMYFVSGTLPFRYTSQTLVLVEKQQVPDAFVKPAMTEDLNMRLATMQEQILSRSRLQPLIERFGLYKDEVGKAPMEELVDRLRHSITVSPVRADFGGTTGGLPGFTISFTANNPRLAQQVCAEITSMFIEENLRMTEQSVQNALDFLRNQLDDSKRKLNEQDLKLAEFKQKYMGQLPDHEQGNINAIASLTSQLESATEQLSHARRDRDNAAMLLQQAETQWSATGQQSPAGGKSQELEQQVAAQRHLLKSLKAKYTDDYPDVIKAKNDLNDLQSELEASKNLPPAAQKSVAEPKELAQVRFQARMLDDEYKSKVAQVERIQRQLTAHQANLQLAPAVEEQYKELTRDHDTALQGYNELLKRVNESEMTSELLKRQQGEQFRVMDPPNLPEKPTFPNRPMFALGGLLAGLGIGIAITLLLEFRDRSIRSEQDVEHFLHLSTLVAVPSMETDWNRDKPAEEQPAAHDVVGV